MKSVFPRSNFVEKMIHRSVRVYRAFLRLYPAEYWTEYAMEQVQVFRDLSREVGDLRSLVALWAYVGGDLVVSVWREQFDARRSTMEIWKRFAMAIGAVFLAIPLLFVILNVLEFELGIAIPWNPFNPVLETANGPMRYLLEGMIVIGPVLAIAAFLLPHLQFRWRPSEDEVAAIGIRRVGGLSLILAALAFLVLLILGIYLVGENLPCVLGEQLAC